MGMRLGSWLAVLGVLMLYLGMTAVLVLTSLIDVGITLEWWVAAAVPPLVYAVSALVGVPQPSLVRVVVGLFILNGVHGLLFALGAMVRGSLEGGLYDLETAAALGTSPVALVVQIITTLLVGLPVRAAVKPRVIHRRARVGQPPPARIRATPLPTAAERQALVAKVAVDAPAVPVAAAPAQPSVVAPQAVIESPAAVVTPTVSALPAMSRGEPTLWLDGLPGAPAEPEIEEAEPELVLDGPTVAIAFERIADQLPGDLFSIPLAELGPHLADPGQVSVPVSLVLPQLSEGVVHVRWSVVAAQFPRDFITGTHRDVASRLPDGSLLLPLDEIVPQVPADTFMLSLPSRDLTGIESFPLPFQPAPPESPTVTFRTASAETAAATPVAEEPRPAPRLAAPPTPTAAVSSDTPEAPSAPLPRASRATEPVWRDVAPPPAVPDRVPFAALEPRAQSDRPAPTARPSALLPPAPAPPAVAAPPIPVEEPAPSVTVVRPSAPAVSHSTVAAPAPPDVERLLSEFECPGTDVRSVAGLAVVTILRPEIDEPGRQGISSLVDRLAGFLTTGADEWPIEQLTIRGSRAAVVATVVGRAAAGGPLLVTAVPGTGSLAMVELRSRRAAARYRSLHPEIGAPTTPPVTPATTNGSPKVATDAVVAALAQALHGFGRTTASVVPAEGSDPALYVFTETESERERVGRLARRLAGVVNGDGRGVAGIGLMGAVAVRLGGRQLVLRPLDGRRDGRGPRPLLVAHGEVRRPGLAYGQVERVAAELATAGVGA